MGISRQEVIVSSESEDGVTVKQAIVNAKQRMLNLVNDGGNLKKDIAEIQGIFHSLMAEVDRLDPSTGSAAGNIPHFAGACGQDDESAESCYRNDGSNSGSDGTEFDASRQRRPRRQNSLKMGTILRSPGGGSTPERVASDGEAGSTLTRQRSGVRLGTAVAAQRKSGSRLLPKSGDSSSEQEIATDAALPPKPTRFKKQALNKTYVIGPASPLKKPFLETDLDNNLTFSPRLTSTMVNGSINTTAVNSLPPSPVRYSKYKRNSPTKRPQFTHKKCVDSSDDSDTSGSNDGRGKRNNLYKLHMQRMRLTPIKSPIRSNGTQSILKSHEVRSVTTGDSNPGTPSSNGTHSPDYCDMTRPSPIGASDSPAQAFIPLKTKSSKVKFLDEVYSDIKNTHSSSSGNSDLESDYTTPYSAAALHQLNPAPSPSRKRGRNNSDSSSSGDFSSSDNSSGCTTISRSVVRNKSGFNVPYDVRVPNTTPEDTINEISSVSPQSSDPFNTMDSNCSMWDSGLTSVLTEVGVILKACNNTDHENCFDREFSKCCSEDFTTVTSMDETYAHTIKRLNAMDKHLKFLSTNHHQQCQNHEVHVALGEPCSHFLDETITMMENSKFDIGVDQLSESGFESTHLESSLESSCVTDASSVNSSVKGSFNKARTGLNMRRMVGLMQYAKQLKQQSNSKIPPSMDDLLVDKSLMPSCQLHMRPKHDRCKKSTGAGRTTVPASLEVTINSTPDITTVQSSPESSLDLCLIDEEHTMMEHNFQSIHGRDYCDSLSNSSDNEVNVYHHQPTNTPNSSFEPALDFSVNGEDRTLLPSPSNDSFSIIARHSLRESRKHPVSHPLESPGLSPISAINSDANIAQFKAPMNTPNPSNLNTPLKNEIPQNFSRRVPASKNETTGLRRQLNFTPPKFRSPLRIQKKYKLHNRERENGGDCQRIPPEPSASTKAKIRRDGRNSDVLPCEIVGQAEVLSTTDKELSYKKKRGIKKKLKLFSNYFHRRDRDSIPELQMLAQL